MISPHTHPCTHLQWEDSATTMDSFHEVVARSVTNFCALYPEACSLVYGCANFYGSVHTL